MKRRDFLAAGTAAGGAAAIGGAGCADRLERLAAPTSESFLQLLDRQLPAIDQSRFVERFVSEAARGPLSDAARARVEESDALFRRMLRTLFISQSFRDLSRETQLEPAVQDRMMDHIAEIGATVFDVSNLLAGLGEAQRREVQDALNGRPDLPMDLAEALDQRAGAVGVDRQRRHQLRGMMRQAAFRLRNGDPGSVIDEYVAKVERVQARAENDAAALALAEKVGERAFWHGQKRAQRQGAATNWAQSAPGQPPPQPPPPQQPYPQQPYPQQAYQQPMLPPPPPRPHPGVGGLKTGGFMMGIGVLIFGASVGLVSAGAEGFIFGATLGAVLFAIGFIVIIVSAIIYAAN